MKIHGINNKGVYKDVVSVLGDLGGGTDDIDVSLSDSVTATVSTSTQTFTFSNPPASGTSGGFTFFITNGGSQTVNWPTSVDWPDGLEPELTISGLDVLTFTTLEGGTIWMGFVNGFDIKSPI